MPPVDDDLDRKIINILSHGKKRRAEIIALLQPDANKNTIGNHLSDLPKYYDFVEKEKDRNKSFFYLTDRKDIRRPKPRANPDRVDDIFREIKRIMEGSSPAIGPTNPPQDFLRSVSELYKMTLKHRCVLYNPSALDRFINIFDLIIERVEGSTTHERLEVSTRSGTRYEQFFLCAKSLYESWEVGHEPEKYHTALSKELDGVQGKIPQLPKGIGLQLQELALGVSKEKGKAFFEELVKSGNYENEVLREKAFYTYDINNSIKDLMDKLSDIQKSIQDDEHAEQIIELSDEIRKFYIEETAGEGNCWE